MEVGPRGTTPRPFLAEVDTPEGVVVVMGVCEGVDLRAFLSQNQLGMVRHRGEGTERGEEERCFLSITE